MMEFTDLSPAVSVQPEEYLRLLGYPRGWVLQGRALELAQWARDWYTKHGRPWIYARGAEGSNLPTLSNHQLQTFRQAEADSVVVAAVSAGPEAEQEARRLWEEEKPDEYFFLEVFASAAVEQLITMTGARLCAWADTQGMAVLPHYSPGYPEWDIAEQPRLLEWIGRETLPGVLDVLDSGALRPKKSLLAVFGLTHRTDLVSRLTGLVPCENCSYTPCQYRRAPYSRAPRYAVNPKALKRWATERLSLHPQDDGTVDALFRYDGTTCTNMGRPLAFHYRVRVGPRDQGYPIREQNCAPAPGDTGHMHMCQYLAGASQLMAAIADEKPLLGRPLREVLDWQRPDGAPGCYCDSISRDHKWGLVLETIHYALSHRENIS
jgi:hypothetical protein